jgi:branched-chain amino acid transport system permease protein
LLSFLLAAAAAGVFIGSRWKRLGLDERVVRAATVATVVLVVLSAYMRADSGTQFLQFTVLGIAAGCVYAIAATGLVLTYTTTGIFNFAHGALGMISAFVYWQLKEESGLPAPIAAIIVLGVLGPLLAILLELMFRYFRDADIGTSIVLTIAVTVMCIGAAQAAFNPGEAHNLSLVLGSRNVTIFDATITWDNVLQIALAIAIALALRALLYTSRTGTAMRAVVDNPTLAALNGASPTRVARISWILGTELAIVAGILFASGGNLEAITLTFFVVNAYGAAVFGKLKSLPMTFAGAIVLGLVVNWGRAFWFPNTESDFYFADADLWRRIGVSLPGIFLFFALLALPQARLSVGRIVSRTTPRVPTLRSSVVRGAAFLAAMGLLVQVIPDENIGDATKALVFAVIMLSLVLLTGYSGQVSLTQYVFVAAGAWAMGSFLDGDSIVGMLLAGLAAIPIGIVVALPALRLQGLYLALVTFGFASVSGDLLIQDPLFYGDGPVAVGRLDLFGLSFAGNKAFFMLCAIVFAAIGVGVLAIKRGPYGRRLAALRDSPAACATLGLDLRLTKLGVFCASAFIAGIGGALFGGQQQSVSDIPLSPINNIVLFLFAAVGGITTITGAFLGGALFAVLPYAQSKATEFPALPGLLFAGVALVAILLGRQPNGLSGIISSALDPWLHGRRADATPTPTAGSAAARPSRSEEVPVGAAD